MNNVSAGLLLSFVSLTGVGLSADSAFFAPFHLYSRSTRLRSRNTSRRDPTVRSSSLSPTFLLSHLANRHRSHLPDLTTTPSQAPTLPVEPCPTLVPLREDQAPPALALEHQLQQLPPRHRQLREQLRRYLLRRPGTRLGRGVLLWDCFREGRVSLSPSRFSWSWFRSLARSAYFIFRLLSLFWRRVHSIPSAFHFGREKLPPSSRRSERRGSGGWRRPRGEGRNRNLSELAPLVRLFCSSTWTWKLGSSSLFPLAYTVSASLVS